MAQKYFHALISRKGNLITLGAQLPIFWRKEVAEKRSKVFNHSTLAKIPIDELNALVNKPIKPKESLKWSYDKKFKQWYVSESAPYARDGFSIKKENENYQLTTDNSFHTVGWFKKLSSAKQVAYLLRHG